MAVNDFLPFASALGSNVTAQADYVSISDRLTGFQAGRASSAHANKAIRQAAAVASMIGQFIVDNAALNANDDGDIPTLEAHFKAAVQAVGSPTTTPTAKTTFAPQAAYATAYGSNTTLSATASITVGGPGMLVAVASRNNGTIDSVGSTSSLYINGTLQEADNTFLTISHMSAANCSAGANSAQIVSTCGVPFSIHIVLFFIPTVTA